MNALKNYAVAMMATLVAIVGTFSYGDVTATKTDGGSVETWFVNMDSTMRREWVAIHDDDLPVDFVGTPGVETIYYKGDRYSSQGYRYIAKCSLTVKEPIVAIEVNFILFDVWGQRTTTLSATDVQDFDVGDHVIDFTWRGLSENEVKKHYASIAYIAKVRTQSGRILAANADEVVEVAREYMDDFTDDLLETDPPKTNAARSASAGTP